MLRWKRYMMSTSNGKIKNNFMKQNGFTNMQIVLFTVAGIIIAGGIIGVLFSDKKNSGQEDPGRCGDNICGIIEEESGSCEKDCRKEGVKDENIISKNGTMRFIDLEGGFYGIVAEDGIRYIPMDMDKNFEQDGLEVNFRAKEAKDAVGIHMWGRYIEIIEMKPINN